MIYKPTVIKYFQQEMHQYSGYYAKEEGRASLLADNASDHFDCDVKEIIDWAIEFVENER
jgi:hypothetical protein